MGEIVQVHFWGPINVSTAEVFRNLLLNSLNVPNISGIEILMSSEGGDLNSGFMMYNYLMSFPLATKVVNMGAIESIALIPFLGASERCAVPNSRFLIHNFYWSFPSGPVDVNRVDERSKSLEADIERFIKIYNERTIGAAKPIDAKLHLTGPAAVIGNPAAFSAGILTTEAPAAPVLKQPSFYDRVFK